MPTADSLKMLRGLAQERSDAAAVKLGQLLARMLEAERNLNLLLEYRRDYQVRLQQSAQRGIGQADWENFRAFLVKLDTAIAEQHKAVARCRDHAQTGRLDWHARQRTLKSYGVLIARRQHAEQWCAVKLEQREQDEQTGKAYAHARLSQDGGGA